HETFGRVHRDGAHRVFTKMLRDFEHEAVAIVRRFERIQDFREMSIKLHVNDGADDLSDFARWFIGHGSLSLRAIDQSASAPEMISMSSLVMFA
ncbi:MAG: hypothetical protein RLZ07_1024, partial [Pseudomonadota bacterium]